MRLNKNILFLIVMSFFILLPSVGFSQTAREKQLLESIRKEKDESKRFKRLLILGEHYKSNNIYRADSLKDVLLQKSRVFDDSLRFSALIYSAEVNEILGRQEEYFRDVLGCQQFLNRLNTPYENR